MRLKWAVRASNSRAILSQGLSCRSIFSGPRWDALRYLSGFGNEVATEALPSALPVGQNTPQRCPYGLYAEQLSGSSFTTPRSKNRRTWMYRILPSCRHGRFHQVTHLLLATDFAHARIVPDQLQWDPLPLPPANRPTDFVGGLVTFCGAGSPEARRGLAIHLYSCNASMDRKAFCNSDGDFLVVPQLGELRLRTEMGLLTVAPGEVCVLPRGIRFTVEVTEPSRGYIAEVYDSHFVLPDLGPIGAWGLANPRDFLTPVAAYEDVAGDWTVVQKFGGRLFEAHQDHSPFDVVAWHGNYAPYKYDLARFCAVNSVTFDHIDPSIFTVLTAPTLEPGVAACDFVVFPPRWMVQDRTFRPPYYHRNCMSEYMGSIRGTYEAKHDGFYPGGGSLHSPMVPHGPDAATFEHGATQELTPTRSDPASLAFMFESTYMLRVTEFAATNLLHPTYTDCWAPLKRHFDPSNR
jgi:homogentisate 1,2-dioxygenase